MNKLLQKYIAGDASEKETQEVMDWLRKDERHMNEYRRQRKQYDITLWQTRAVSPVSGEKRLWKRSLDIAIRVAAVVALVMASAYFYNHRDVPTTTEEMQSVIVPPGQYAELHLSDGTQVWLNSGSRLTFPGQFAGDTRRVVLDGEGYFKVHSSAQRPFIVETHRCDVRVLGTEFNVLAYQKDSVWETALLKGSVEILQKSNGASLMKLEPYTTASFSRNSLTKGTVYETDYFRWHEGLICFNNISLRDMIDKLKLYYNVNFIINNRQILDAHYTGKFRKNDGIEHVMRVLSLNTKFTYTKDDDNNTITIN